MTDIDRIAALLHENHLGCRLDYRGDWDCDGPARHRQMASRIAAGVTLAPTPPDAAIDPSWLAVAFIRNGWFIDHVEAKQEAVKIIAWYEEIKPVAPTPPDALVRAVIRLHDSLSPDETRGVLWRNVEDALYPRGASASDLAPPPDALGEALAQIDGERIRAEAELGGEPWERWRNQGVIAALGFAAAHVRAALEATP